MIVSVRSFAARHRFHQNVDVFAAIAGVLIGAIISLLNLMYSNEYMITIGPMLIIVCLAYLLLRRKLLSPAVEPEASRRFMLVISIIFWLCFAGSTFSLTTETLHRPVIYFILISIAASMIALQILYCRQKSTTYLILFEILLLSLSVRASAFWVFPTLPGADPWGHVEYIKLFVTQGHIPQTTQAPLPADYLYFPMMHLGAASVNLVGGVGYKMAMFLGASVPLALSTVFVFLVGRKLVNAKVGLLAAALIGLGDYHLMWSIQIIAMSLGIALFATIIYLFFGGSVARKPTIAFVMLMLVTLLLTHTVSAFIMACFMLFLLVGARMYRFLYRQLGTQRAESVVTPHLLLAFVVAMLAYWTFAARVAGGHFFDVMVRWYYGSITTEASFFGRPPAEGGIEAILNILGYLLMLSCGILGCLLWLSPKHQDSRKVALIAALAVMIALPLSFPVFGIANIEPTRWFAFSYAILSIVAAVALLAVVSHMHHQMARNALLICAIFATVFFMITNNVANMDSPIYSSQLNERMEYTKSEMATAQWTINAYDGRIITDMRYGADAMKYQFLGKDLDISYKMLVEEQLNSGLVIWRDVLAERPAMIVSEGSRQIVVIGESLEQDLQASHNLIYTNNASKAFLARGE